MRSRDNSIYKTGLLREAEHAYIAKVIITIVVKAAPTAAQRARTRHCRQTYANTARMDGTTGNPLINLNCGGLS